MKRARRAKPNINVNSEEDASENVFPELNKIKLVEVKKQVFSDFPDIFEVVLKQANLESSYLEIINLKDRNNQPIFSETTPHLNLDLLQILLDSGLDNFKNWISQTDVAENNNVIWDHEIFDEMKINELLDADIFLNRKQPVKGVGICQRCKNEYLFVTMKQTRASDEPITVFFYCPNCGKRWTE